MGYKIGHDHATLVTLASLGVPDPKGYWQSYSEVVPLASGGVRGVGYPRVRWHWDFLDSADRESLRHFCSGAGTAVNIETVTFEADIFDEYTAIAIWPLEEELDSHHRMDFDIEFVNIVVV